MSKDKIKIFAHRGYWDNTIQPNSKEALVRALKEGFSIETDIRDFVGNEIAISHDPITINEKGLLTLNQFLIIFDKYSNKDSSVALNIKADGLEGLLNSFNQLINNDSFFFFDGSFPSMKRLKESDLKCLDRVSEFESPSNYFFDGLWVDAFCKDWIINSDHLLLKKYNNVIFVSPELHNRPHKNLWNWLKEYNNDQNQMIGLCTDFPDKAREYFND